MPDRFLGAGYYRDVDGESPRVSPLAIHMAAHMLDNTIPHLIANRLAVVGGSQFARTGLIFFAINKPHNQQ